MMIDDMRIQVSESVLDTDLILIPINCNLHWTLAVIDLKVHEFRYYDSMVSHSSHHTLSGGECVVVVMGSGSMSGQWPRICPADNTLHPATHTYRRHHRAWTQMCYLIT
jgi:hypothetical protein